METICEILDKYDINVKNYIHYNLIHSELTNYDNKIEILDNLINFVYENIYNSYFQIDNDKNFHETIRYLNRYNILTERNLILLYISFKYDYMYIEHKIDEEFSIKKDIIINIPVVYEKRKNNWKNILKYKQKKRLPFINDIYHICYDFERQIKLLNMYEKPKRKNLINEIKRYFKNKMVINELKECELDGEYEPDYSDSVSIEFDNYTSDDSSDSDYEEKYLCTIT